MTKLRNRLLASLVLAAVLLSSVGVQIAAARPSQRRHPSGTTTQTALIRPGAGSFSGEPDAPGPNGAPMPSVKPASLGTLPGSWLWQMWIRWKSRDHFAQHRPAGR